MNYNVANLPDEYRIATDEELKKRISARKKELGDKVVILTHHYQRYDIVKFHDFLGDSYSLAKNASEQNSADKIIFCGVLFMAEAADRPIQRVGQVDDVANAVLFLASDMSSWSTGMCLQVDGGGNA